jgi:hypothetical protein
LARQVKLKAHSEQSILILGIVTTESLVKLSWVINHSFKTKLSQTDSITVHDTKSGHATEFSMTQFEDEISLVKWSLIVNRSKPFCFLDEFKNIDYLLFISFTDNSNSYAGVNIELKKIKEISSVIPISFETIKKKKRIETFYI